MTSGFSEEKNTVCYIKPQYVFIFKRNIQTYQTTHPAVLYE